jgi:hypothetical protein
MWKSGERIKPSRKDFRKLSFGLWALFLKFISELDSGEVHDERGRLRTVCHVGIVEHPKEQLIGAWHTVITVEQLSVQ